MLLIWNAGVKSYPMYKKDIKKIKLFAHMVYNRKYGSFNPGLLTTEYVIYLFSWSLKKNLFHREFKSKKLNNYCLIMIVIKSEYRSKFFEILAENC